MDSQRILYGARIRAHPSVHYSEMIQMTKMMLRRLGKYPRYGRIDDRILGDWNLSAPLILKT